MSRDQTIQRILAANHLDPNAVHPGLGWGAAEPRQPGGPELVSTCPASGAVLGRVKQADGDDYEAAMDAALDAFKRWRTVPAPQRGELVRRIGERLRANKEALGELVSLEMGKIRAEGLGEVQEAIDIAEFAVGLSRQLYGLTIASERPSHRMMEQWHPLGPVGVITAFNFPVAVWAWNAMVALVCGDVVVWKPSPLTPLTSIATHKLCEQVCVEMGYPGIIALVQGETEAVGHRMVEDRRVPLISATGSCRMGREVAQVVAGRLGKVLLELGGNNAMIVCDDADLELAIRGVVFGAVGTAGQRCTSTRRLYLQRGIHDAFLERLEAAYQQVKVGDPLAEGTLMGPLATPQAVADFEACVAAAQEQGGRLVCGGKRRAVEGLDGGHWVEPTIIACEQDLPLMQHETFAPVLYVVPWDDFDDVMERHNDVPQGLSSAIFTDSVKTAERFLSAAGSDCGIANVNLGTSGAEIGGAFGGEKDTGGGRESGSDSWRQYMRRQTNTVNYGDDLPLAQGISFG